MRAVRLIFTLFAIFSGPLLFAHFEKQTYHRADIYSALRSDEAGIIVKQIKLVEKSTDNSTIAFYGALLMKQAGSVKDPAQKLKIFKSGHAKLDEAISTDQN